MIKNNFNDSGVNVDYIEEVDVKQINNDNSIYNYSRSNGKSVILLVLLTILIITLLSSVMFAFVYFNKDIEKSEVVKYTLLVTHSNDYYGAQDISFDKYLSAENAYNYYFKINNQNSIALNYRIQINNPNYGYDNIDQSKIEYVLQSNNSIMDKGNFVDAQTFDLLSTSIASNVNQEYILKIWSNNIDKNLKYSFKVNIIV